MVWLDGLSNATPSRFDGTGRGSSAARTQPAVRSEMASKRIVKRMAANEAGLMPRMSLLWRDPVFRSAVRNTKVICNPVGPRHVGHLPIQVVGVCRGVSLTSSLAKPVHRLNFVFKQPSSLQVTDSHFKLGDFVSRLRRRENFRVGRTTGNRLVPAAAKQYQ